MPETYDAEVIRKRLNSSMGRRALFGLLVQRADEERWKQEHGKNNMMLLCAKAGMLTSAEKIEEWWRLAEHNQLTLDMIHF